MKDEIDVTNEFLAEIKELLIEIIEILKAKK